MYRFASIFQRLAAKSERQGQLLRKNNVHAETRFLYHPLYNDFYLASKLLILRRLAPRHGFEPRFTAPKAAVLPLDDRGKWESDSSVAFTDESAQSWETRMVCYADSGSVSHPVVGMVFKTIERLLRPLIGSTPIRSRQIFTRSLTPWACPGARYTPGSRAGHAPHTSRAVRGSVAGWAILQ